MKIVKAKRSGRNRVEIVFDDDQKVSLAYEIFLKNQLKAESRNFRRVPFDSFRRRSKISSKTECTELSEQKTPFEK